MKFSFPRALTIAKREYVTTIRRKAFLFTLVFVPAYYALITALPGMLVGKSIAKRLSELHVIAVVDSSGALANAPHTLESEMRANSSPFDTRKAPPPQKFSARVEFYPTYASADSALRAGVANVILVIPSDYVATGRFRRYTKESGIF